jgi:hypothetical protein
MQQTGPNSKALMSSLIVLLRPSLWSWSTASWLLVPSHSYYSGPFSQGFGNRETWQFSAQLCSSTSAAAIVATVWLTWSNSLWVEAFAATVWYSVQPFWVPRWTHPCWYSLDPYSGEYYCCFIHLSSLSYSERWRLLRLLLSLDYYCFCDNFYSGQKGCWLIAEA